MRIPHPTFSGAIAILALFVALGGSAYAAIQITGNNIVNGTVSTKDLKNRTIQGVDVDNGSLTTRDVKDGSLRTDDFDSAQLAGLAGTPTVTTRRAELSVPAFQGRERAVRCRPNETVVGGGAGISGQAAAQIFESAPIEADGSRPEDDEESRGWSARGVSGFQAETLNVFVLCASR